MVPVVIRLPIESLDKSAILYISLPVLLSLSFCVLSQSPVQILSATNPSSILLTKTKLSEIRKVTTCENGSDDSLYATVLSSRGGTGSIRLTTIENEIYRGNEANTMIQSPGWKEFTIPSTQYKSYLAQISSIGEGLTMDVSLESGTVEIIVTFCSDWEGRSVGSVTYPDVFSTYFEPEDLVNLMEKTSCSPDIGALYHDLEKNPPPLVIRIRSEKASGVLKLSSAKKRSRRSIPVQTEQQMNITVDTENPFSFHFSDTLNELNFEVVSGVVTLFSKCEHDNETEVGMFEMGKHTVSSEDLTSNLTDCENSTVILTFRSDLAVLQLSSSLVPISSPFKFTLWMYVLIIAVSIVVIVLAGFLIYCLSTIRTRTVRFDDETPHNHIPMTTNWM